METLMVTNGGYRNAGMFSYIQQVIGNLHVADSKGLKMWINLPHTPYMDLLKGDNCWDYYFLQPFGITKNDLPNYVIDEQEWFEGKIDTITPNFTPETLQRAKVLISKYIKLQPNIQNKIESFQKEVIKTPNYGSVHFRGTDHHYNAAAYTFPIIPHDIYFNYIDQLLTKFDKVLVCSDEQQFIDSSLAKFGSEKIVSYPSIRSDNKVAIHYSNIPNKFTAGEDVIIESYLMSYSKYLIRTCSGVSLFSVFNSQDPSFKYLNIDEVYYGKKHNY